MEFLEKNKLRGSRHARSLAIRIKRTHKKIHLGEETREEGYGARAPGILVKTGIRTSQPSNANWREKQAKSALVVGQAILIDQMEQVNADRKYIRYMSGFISR